MASAAAEHLSVSSLFLACPKSLMFVFGDEQWAWIVRQAARMLQTSGRLAPWAWFPDCPSQSEAEDPSPIWMRASGAVSFQTISPFVKLHFA